MSVPDIKGRGDLTWGEGGGKEEGGGRKAGEGAEGGAQSSMDGKCAGTWVGKEGTLSYDDLVWEMKNYLPFCIVLVCFHHSLTDQIILHV